MAKFLMAYHGGRAPDTPEEGTEVMAAWEAWFASMGRAVDALDAEYAEWSRAA